MSGKQSRIFLAIQIGLPFLLFLSLAGNGIFEFFGGDDVMNLFDYSLHPISHWALGAVEFWSSAWYRPLGGIVHLALFRLFGFHAIAFKLFLFLVLFLNLILCLRTARALSGSVRIASWALLLCCYHAALDGLYLDFGTIYDVLGYSCYFSALLIYAVWVCGRSRRVAVLPVIGLYLAGLGLKEMDVTLPAILLVYNLALTDSLRKERWSWAWKSGLPVVACAVSGAVYTVGKLSGPGSLTNQDLYAPHFTLHQYAVTSAHYIGQLFYLGDKYPTNTAALWILALTIAIAALLRSRLLIFCALAAILSQLPVSFIPWRLSFVIYIPVAFWALYLAGLLNKIGPVFQNPRRAFICFLIAAAGLAVIHLRMKRLYDPNFTDQAAAYKGFSRQLDNWGVRPLPTSRVLLINDPFPADWNGWDPTFIVNVRSATTGIILIRMKFMTSVIPLSEIDSYDYVIDYRNGWQLLKSPGSSSAPAAARMRDIADKAPVLLLDGFGPPEQGGWRGIQPSSEIRVKPGDARSHRLAVSMFSYGAVKLQSRLDDGGVTDEGVHGPGNFELSIPVANGNAGDSHTVAFGLGDPAGKGKPPQLFFVGAQLNGT